MSDLLELVKDAPCGVVYGIDENPGGVEGPNIVDELAAVIAAADAMTLPKNIGGNLGVLRTNYHVACHALAAKLEASR